MLTNKRSSLFLTLTVPFPQDSENIRDPTELKANELILSDNLTLPKDPETTHTHHLLTDN
jgi:hypothetical protein